jgi:hypothetical protein
VVAAAPASARIPAKQATDPNANSPAGVVYSIPLDSARQDAAPHIHAAAGGAANNSGSSGGPTGGGNSGAGAVSGSSPAGSAGASSEGASSAGQAAKSRSGNAGGAGGASGHAHTVRAGTVPVLVPGGQPGSLVHSANGFGSSSSVPGLDSAPSSGLGAVQSNASSAPLLAILLAGLVMAIGAYAGVRARRTPRDHPPASSS